MVLGVIYCQRHIKFSVSSLRDSLLNTRYCGVMDVFFSTDDPVKTDGNSGQSYALWERGDQDLLVTFGNFKFMKMDTF